MLIPKCISKLFKQKPQYPDWAESFSKIDIFGGEFTFIENNGQDMFEIIWPDGMIMDVGYIEEDKTYYITTVTEDSSWAWNNPLSEAAITNRRELIPTLQKEIKKCRSNTN